MMMHPSYVDLMEAVNKEALENGEEPVVTSRYSIVMASAKRARQIVSGSTPMAGTDKDKPLSRAVQELYQNKVEILRNLED